MTFQIDLEINHYKFVFFFCEFMHKAQGKQENKVRYSALREKYLNTEFFLICIFLYVDQKNLRIWTLFTYWWLEQDKAVRKDVLAVLFPSGH